VASLSKAPLASPHRASSPGVRASAASDDDLVRAIAGGDRAALAQLYDRWAGILVGLAGHILRERAESEDVVHDVFVTVMARADEFDRDRGAVGAWLVTLVKNLAIDRARRRQRRSALEQKVLANEPRALPGSPEEELARAAARAEIRGVVASLTVAQRSTLQGVFYEGRTYAETAAAQHLAVGTLKSRAHRALSALRAELARRGFEDDAKDGAIARTPERSEGSGMDVPFAEAAECAARVP
jgi:RNA polymerase sigma-70 factor (ECF subfamily)